MICSKCNIEKPKEEFRYRNDRKAYIASCKECGRAYGRAYMKSQPGKVCASKFSKTFKGRFKSLCREARKRGLLVEITREQYKILSADAVCIYCGDTIVTGIGLDRIDGSCGYNLSNVVPACKICNMTRSDIFTFQQMLEIGKLVRRWKAEGTLLMPTRLVVDKNLVGS